MLDFLRIEGNIQDYNSLVKFSQIQFTTDINLDSSELVPQYENERYKWYYFKGKYQRYYLNIKQKICRLSGFSTYYLVKYLAACTKTAAMVKIIVIFTIQI